MRVLTDAELELITGGEETVIDVVGRRPRRSRWNYSPPPLDYPYASADDGNYGSSGGGDEAAQNDLEPAQPGDVPCMTPAQQAALPPADRDRYEVQRIAGRIHRQIVDRSTADDVEFASLIYRNRAGDIVFTRVPQEGAVPSAWDLSVFDADPGLWANVVGYIHNHPYTSQPPANDPNYYAFPSFDHPDPLNPGQSVGDWVTFDHIKTNMMQQGATQATADNLVQYVSTLHNGRMRLYEYANWDRDRDTLGKEINPALDHCPS